VGDQAPAIGRDRALLLTLDDDRGVVGRGEVEVAARSVDPVLRIEDLGELRRRSLLRHPSTHGFSSIVRRDG
jgi:hypothetical protein